MPSRHGSHQSHSPALRLQLRGALGSLPGWGALAPRRERASGPGQRLSQVRMRGPQGPLSHPGLGLCSLPLDILLGPGAFHRLWYLRALDATADNPGNSWESTVLEFGIGLHLPSLQLPRSPTPHPILVPGLLWHSLQTGAGDPLHGNQGKTALLFFF